MKGPALILLTLAFLASNGRAVTPTFVADWRFINAAKSARGIFIPDRTSNGYMLIIPSGATLESDSTTPGGKALILDGSIKEGIRLPMNMMALANMHLALRVKPSSSCSGICDLLAGGRWKIRYTASKKTLQLFIYQISTEKLPPRVVVEFKAKTDEWNLVVVDVFPEKIEARVNDSTTVFTTSAPGVRYAPIEEGPVTLFRCLENSTFTGAVTDFSLGYTPDAK